MRNLSRIQFFLGLIALIVIPVGFNACNKTFDGPASGPSQYSTGPVTGLQVSPQTAYISANQSQTFVVTGGREPYSYSITSGYGTIDAFTGTFTASGYSGTTQIMVADSTGQVALASVVVSGGTTVSTSPSSLGPPTNCSNVLNQPNIGFNDGSTSGLAYVRATQSFSDPNSCANWCGQIGAGICEWSQNANSPVCVAWPQGTAVTEYPTDSTQWAVYASQCSGSATSTCEAGSYNLTITSSGSAPMMGTLYLSGVSSSGAVTGLVNVPGASYTTTGNCLNGSINFTYTSISCTGSYSGTSMNGTCSSGSTWIASR